MTHSPQPVVLKFGSSVLRTAEDIPRVATEIYRYAREARTVLAVVSAYEGRTDQLMSEASEMGLKAGCEAFIRMVSTGEYASAQDLIDRLEMIGLSAELMTPREMSLTATGDVLSARPIAVDVHRVQTGLERSRILVVPGFSAIDKFGETVLMGRGGSDMTAIFLASALHAAPVRLIKDVDGLYDTDPNLNPRARRYSKIDWQQASNIGGVLVQPEAIEFASECDVEIDVARIGQVGGTRIGKVTAPAKEAPNRRPLRVALAGCGTVGGGVLQRLMQEPERYEVTRVLVRDEKKYSGSAPVVTTHRRLLHPRPDVLIEAIHGDQAARLHIDALSEGISVVTANKQAVAENLVALSHVARTQNSSFKYSACVGGAAPILETIVAQSNKRRIAKVEAILNGTVNFIGCRLSEGMSFPDALSLARDAGFIEEDPRADLSGADALAKARIIAHHAFADLGEVRTLGIEAISGGPAAEHYAEEGRLNQLVTIEPSEHGGVGIRIKMASTGCPTELLRLRDEYCGAMIRFEDGGSQFVSARGAGRVPTTESVLGDLGEIERDLITAGQLDRKRTAMRLDCALDTGAG